MYVFLYLIILPFPPFWSRGSSQKLLNTLWHISMALANAAYLKLLFMFHSLFQAEETLETQVLLMVIRMVEDNEPKMPGTLLISSASRG